MAAFTNADIDITINFDADGNFTNITDNADYSSFDDMPLSALKGLGQMTDPFSDLVFQKNTVGDPLIDLSASDTVSGNYSLPVTTLNKIVNGSYILSYNVRATFSATDIAVPSITVASQQAGLTGDFTYLHAGDTVEFYDSTNINNNGDKVVVSVVSFGGGTTVVEFAPGSFDTNEAGLDGTLAQLGEFGEIIHNYTASFTVTYTGCTAVTPLITIESSCTNENITIYDSTNVSGQTVVLRDLVLIYPPGLVDPVPISPVSTTNPSITVAELANGQYTGTLSLDMSYTQTDGLVVTYSVYTTDTHAVSCTNSLCCLEDCIENLYERYAPCEDGKVNAAYQVKISKVAYLINWYNLAKSCGDLDQAAAVAQMIKDVLGDDCTCCGDSDGPSWVNSSVSGITDSDFSPAIFNGIIPYLDTGTLGPSGTSLPTSDLSALAINPGFFQFASELSNLGLTYGKKYVDISFSALQGTGNSTITLTIGGQDVISAVAVNLDSWGTFNVRIGTKLSGSATVFCIQVTGAVYDTTSGNPPAIVGPLAYEFSDLTTFNADLTVAFTPGGAAAANMAIIAPTILPFKTV